MSLEHLRNTEKMIRRKAVSDYNAYWSIGSMLTGDMATYAWENSMKEESDLFFERIMLADDMANYIEKIKNNP